MKYKLINLKKGGIIFFILLITIISNVYCQYNPPPSDYSLLEPQNFNNDVILPAQINTFLNGTCDNTMSNTSIDFVNKYYPLSFWIPNNNTPIKKIQIAIHVFSGTNSMTVADIPWVNAVVNQINNNLANICLPSDPITGVTHIVDSRIRFELSNRIFFYDNSPYYNSSNTYGMLSYINSIDPTRLDYLSILVPINGSGIQNATTPDVSAWGLYNYNMFAFVPGNNTQNWSWHTVLQHELGHCLDLLHTYEPSCCHETCNINSPDYLWDVFGNTNNPNCWHDASWSCDPYSSANTCTNNWMGGWHSACYLSPLQIARFHRAISIKSLRRYVKDELISSTIPYNITSNETWNFDMRWYGDIFIKPNTTLTVKCNLYMSKGAKIIIEPGAKLIVDGGKISNLCGNMWQGIEVWGNSNLSQNSILSSPQGIVELKNGAVIENAENAITLWHPGYWNSMGGIVYANNATFLNNRRSVEFMAYQNTTPNGNPIRNLSQFTNCTFKVDDNYRGGSSNPFSHHVTLWAVNGVFFTACNFLNEQSNKVYDPYNNKAIYSIDAGYTVTGSCSQLLMYGQTCPDEYLSKSTFKGFNVAIHASGSGTLNIVKVDESVFEENVRGVQFDVVNNSWINKSEFKIGNNSVSNSPDNHEGIFIRGGSTGFRIEENNLQLSSISVPQTIGIRINSSSLSDIGGINNQIYKNTISNLRIGEQAEGVNRDNAYNGLKILCTNHYNNTMNDILVRKNNQNNYSQDGICIYQGSSVPPLSAGNLFSDGLDCNYLNSTPNNIFYFHTGAGLPTKPNICGNISLSEIQVANACPSNFNNGYGFPLSAVSKLQLSTEYTVNESAYINLLYNYNNLIDGGNKNWLLEKIEMSWPQDAWDLRAELLSHSPYLSEEILRETAMKGILPQAMLLEICLANPDGTRNEEFLRFLGEKIPNPLPQYMLDLIYANRDIKTARTLLETNLSAVNSKMAYISGLLISDCMFDSTQLKTEARSWLLRRASLADYYSVAESYIENNDFTSANATADQIINIFELNEEQQAEFQNFRNYTDFRRSISESGRSIMQLESSEIELLQQIANATTGRTSAMAQNILCFGYQLCVDYLPADGDGNHLKFTKPEKTAKQILQSAYNKITVTPNPANVYVAFNYELPLLENNAVLYITDAMGKTITQKSISSKKGQWVWDTRNINKGIYFYEIKTAAESYGNGKIVISK